MINTCLTEPDSSRPRQKGRPRGFPTVASTREPNETLRPDSLSAQMASLSDLTALRPWNAGKVNREETKRKEGA